MSTPSTDLDDVVQTAILSADLVAMRPHRTEAERTRAVVRAALTTLLVNGVIEILPRSEWADWIEISDT